MQCWKIDDDLAAMLADRCKCIKEKIYFLALKIDSRNNSKNKYINIYK